ncbi:phosphotransferase family protein [Aspergillus candidus]|uniref:Aminoglycoside phosphotransferase domain-containing protein n=1 Tax=Aspergillus candidus TaxID=41067 RepID=A0A2I2F0W6_ASPCN|nr:hypothetical protein BDW47DRAFT_129172 [Aspergillus candidus]PLB34269.1 hypothetical protein BDW47DRAFT_129172 [Aspergillus candidus]
MRFRFSFDDGRPDIIIRFPKPGHTATAYRDEKVMNEVEIMDNLRQHTNIPIPRVHSWGRTAESPQHLGPFIIMDYVDGTLLSTILKQPDQEDMILNPNIDSTTLYRMFDQIAYYLFQLSQPTFTGIGAISKGATVAGYPVQQFPTASFDHASDYLRSVANEHLTHLWAQRNLADDAEIAQQRYIARHRPAQLISKYYPEDCGLSIPFCDDMRPSNMLVDPETLQITPVLDFEFTNSMPAEFTYDPPWWMLLSGTEVWLERCAMDKFVTLCESRMVQFLRAFDVDTIYWAALHNGDAGVGVELLDGKARAEAKLFTQTKMKQLKTYKEECTARFSSET